jgi:hypothetical protein
MGCSFSYLQPLMRWKDHERGNIFKTGQFGEIFHSKQQMTRLTLQSIINNKHIISQCCEWQQFILFLSGSVIFHILQKVFVLLKILL